jgi:hypothetical protein
MWTTLVAVWCMRLCWTDMATSSATVTPILTHNQVLEPLTCGGQLCWSSPQQATLCATAPASTAVPAAITTAASTSMVGPGQTSFKEPQMQSSKWSQPPPATE